MARKRIIILKKRKRIDSFLTFMLIVVTIALLVATCFQIKATIAATKATEAIKDVEVYLAKERMKKDIEQNINLAGNLITELGFNRLLIIDINDSLERLKNRTEYHEDRLMTEFLEQANKNAQFGNNDIHIQLKIYLTHINSIKNDLKEIEVAQSKGDKKIKRERIDRTLHITSMLLEGKETLKKIDEFIKDIDDYKKDQEQVLRDLDKKMQEELLELTKNK